MCSKELTCSLKEESDGIFSRKCQLESGGSCALSDHCGEGLKCAIRGNGERVCLDPKGLAIGESCIPTEGPKSNCGLLTLENNDTPYALMCLPKNEGNVCQVEARIVEDCSAEKNKVCSEGLMCDGVTSLCLPKIASFSNKPKASES